MFEVIIMNLAQNVCLDAFRSTLKVGHLGSKIRSPGRKENLVNPLEVTFF